MGGCGTIRALMDSEVLISLIMREQGNMLGNSGLTAWDVYFDREGCGIGKLRAAPGIVFPDE